jgi:molybdate transport system substrate-binding protein
MGLSASSRFLLRVISVGVLLGAPMSVGAADITLLTTTNLKPIIDELVGPFEKMSGHHLVIDHGGAAPVKNRIAAGEFADVVMHSRFALDDLEKQGRVRPGTIQDIAHSSVGVAMRAGGVKPDMATLEQFKAALLAAPSLATPDPAGGSLGGVYFVALATKLGIGDAIRPKLVLTGPATATAELVAKGGAALGIDQLTQFSQVSGLDLVDPLPAELKTGVAMAAGIGAAARQPEAALAWIDFLASPAAAVAKQAHGMQP